MITFIVESGLGLEDANAYVSLDYFNQYCTDRGITNTYTDDEKKQMIIKATDYIDNVFYGSFKGVTLNIEQSLQFPRIILDDTIYPLNLSKATVELAIKAFDTDLMEDKNQQVVKEKVGALEVQYSEYSNQQTQYSFVYNLLKPYLIGNSNSKKIIRA